MRQSEVVLKRILLRLKFKCPLAWPERSLCTAQGSQIGVKVQQMIVSKKKHREEEKYNSTHYQMSTITYMSWRDKKT